MANFPTHLSFAALGSGLFSITLVSIQQASPTAAFSYFCLGTLGGLLPDIDADNSVPIRLAFGSGALLGGFLCALYLPPHYALSERLLVGLAAYWLLRYPLLAFFNTHTRHRGIIHSVPAAAFFTFMTTGISYQLFHTPALIAWWQGIFVGFGFLLHLVLDELYSVDLYGARLKNSFGTALKIVQWDNLFSSSLMYLAAGLSYLSTPAPQVWLAVVLEPRTYRLMATHFWPRNGWFSDLLGRLF
jgi:hypothetical protein